MKSIGVPIWLCGLSVLAAACFGAADPGGATIDYLAPTGWQRVTTEPLEGKLAIRLIPSVLGVSQTALVINKPDWMTLTDGAPPALTGVRVDDRSLKVVPDLQLGAFWKLPDEIRIALADESNPLDQETLRVLLDGKSSGLDWEFLPAAGPAPQKAGELRLRLHRLVPGVHQLTVSVADRSPFANATTYPLRIAVNGHRISENGQRLTLVAGGVEYVVRPEFQRFLSVGDSGVHLHPTVQFRRPFYGVRRFTHIQTVVDEPAHQVIRVDAVPSELNTGRLSRYVALQFEFELAGASKLLQVTTRVFNRSHAPGALYCFWGDFRGAGYVLPGADKERNEERSWTHRYIDIGVADWVFVPPVDPHGVGLGIVSPQPLGESRFGGLLLYTDPKKVRVRKGGSVELRFGVTPAATPEEVIEAQRQFERAVKPPPKTEKPAGLPT